MSWAFGCMFLLFRSFSKIIEFIPDKNGNTACKCYLLCSHMNLVIQKIQNRSIQAMTKIRTSISTRMFYMSVIRFYETIIIFIVNLYQYSITVKLYYQKTL